MVVTTGGYCTTRLKILAENKVVFKKCYNTFSINVSVTLFKYRSHGSIHRLTQHFTLDFLNLYKILCHLPSSFPHVIITWSLEVAHVGHNPHWLYFGGTNDTHPHFL